MSLNLIKLHASIKCAARFLLLIREADAMSIGTSTFDRMTYDLVIPMFYFLPFHVHPPPEQHSLTICQLRRYMLCIIWLDVVCHRFVVCVRERLSSPFTDINIYRCYNYRWLLWNWMVFVTCAPTAHLCGRFIGVTVWREMSVMCNQKCQITISLPFIVVNAYISDILCCMCCVECRVYIRAYI